MATFYVSPTGSNANNGSITQPFETVDKALTVVEPGDTIYLRGGTHEFSDQYATGLLIYNKDGEPDNLIKLWAYPGERPVFVPADPLVTRTGIGVNASYWHIKGIEITGIEQWMINEDTATFVMAFYVVDSTGSIFEEIESHHNEGVGFYLHGNSTDNLILNCDFHHNADPLTVGNAYGNADGMEIRVEYTGTTNEVRGVRAWNNSDDGIDTWYTAGLVVIEDCWAFWNGYAEGTTTERGDGNGFKLGPYLNHGTAPDLTNPLRTVTRSMAFQNRLRGFDWNDGLMRMHIFNNSSFDNALGYFFNGAINYQIKNNVSLNDASSHIINAAATQSNNTWNTGFSVSSSDFVSISPTGSNGARQSDGSLPDTDFLKLVSGSDLVDAGVDVGYDYSGSNPDIGAKELTTAITFSPARINTTKLIGAL